MLFLTRKWGIALHTRSRYGDLIELLRKRYDAAIIIGNIEYAMNGSGSSENIIVRANDWKCKGFLIVQVHQYESEQNPQEITAEGGMSIPLFELGDLNINNLSHLSFTELYKYVEGDFIIPTIDKVGKVIVWFCPVYIDESQRHSVNIDY